MWDVCYRVSSFLFSFSTLSGLVPAAGAEDVIGEAGVTAEEAGTAEVKKKMAASRGKTAVVETEVQNREAGALVKKGTEAGAEVAADIGARIGKRGVIVEIEAAVERIKKVEK